ncbi:MAG: M10 family metallopeptidase C-terminal domain-containing protein [Candidatus Saccharibacteria bacterium]|nr:M10 family metallopeptidase C-terminal domain-containing protein [Pseudorhodobacter sp.]
MGDHAIFGGKGQDQLNGGLGRDTLTGDNGADLFAFRTPGDSGIDRARRDRVSDYSSAQHDQIDLNGIDAGADNQAFHLIMTNFKRDAEELRPAASGGNVVVMGDIDGDGRNDIAILVQGIASLNAAVLVL